MQAENPIGVPFYELSEVDSSNNYAMQMVQSEMAEHGATWFAYYQNAGKGQRGKQWKGDYGLNIMMSSVFKPGILSIDNQFILNACVALACFDFFDTYANGKTSIKWPNDIYWEDRKAVGILIESVLKGKEWRFSIVGIGININQTLFSEGLLNPVSLKQITGKNYDVVVLAKHLCTCLENRWRQVQSSGFEKIVQEYISHMYKINEVVTFKNQNAVFEAVVKGVDEQGRLLIDTGTATKVDPGSVEWLLPQLK